MENFRFELVVFVARASSGASSHQIPLLQRSLEWTKTRYDVDYGAPPVFEFLTFVGGSNNPLRPTGDVCTFFRLQFTRVLENHGRLVVVQNGWDGLTTDTISFLRLFERHASLVTFRVFADVPRRFYQASAAQVCAIFNAEIDIGLGCLNPTEEQQIAAAQLTDSTALFARNLRQIGAIKEIGAANIAALRDLSIFRNTDPARRDLAKYRCSEPGCKDECFPTVYALNRHKNHRHHGLPAEQLRCQYCGADFARTDNKDRHEKDAVCEQNPSHRPKPTALQERAPRGSKKRQRPENKPQGAEGGFLTYHGLMTSGNRDLLLSLPRLEMDPARLPADRTEDVIYRHELVCRFPGCVNVHVYAEGNKLRVHYGNAHGYHYQPFSKGLNAHLNKLNDDGLEWLAQVAQRGLENVGEKPWPSG